ncbi:MAG TPA: CAP domain-containing protein [Polyangiaceae bacterium]|nr:CAP domain-containing protein [Polyangiaceae bacterium]
MDTSAGGDAAPESATDAAMPALEAGSDSSPGREAGSDATADAAEAGRPSCPTPPAGIPQAATDAMTLMNQLRAAMGSPCANMVPALNTAAQNHCVYYSTNTGMCTSSPQVEVTPNCSNYDASQASQRDQMAGYTGTFVAENMAFIGNGTAAIQLWLNSVWHRLPLLSPWVVDFGYGVETGCDTMDFGAGAGAPATLVVAYPYDGQTMVTTTYNGAVEGPTPLRR